MTDHHPNASGGDNSKNHDERLLTIAEAADLLRTSIDTLRYWRYLRTGPRSFRLGRRVFYRYTDLIAWINQQLENDGPHAA